MSAAIEKGEIKCVDEMLESIHGSKPHQVLQIDNFNVLGLDKEDADFYINYPEEKRNRVIHKVSCTPLRTL